MLRNLIPFMLCTSIYATEPVIVDCFKIEKVESDGHGFYVMYVHDNMCKKCQKTQ